MDLDLISRMVNSHINGAILSSGAIVVDTLKPYVKMNLTYCEQADKLTPELEQIKQGCEALLNDKFVPDDYSYNIADILNPYFAQAVHKGTFMLDINYTNASTEFEKKLAELEANADIRQTINSCRRFETKIALVLSTINEKSFKEFIADATIDIDLAYTGMVITNAGIIRQPNPRIGDYNLFITNGIDTVAINVKAPFTSDFPREYYLQLRNVCNVCLNASRKRCPCKKARYCSAECQKIHRRLHKQHCVV